MGEGFASFTAAINTIISDIGDIKTSVEAIDGSVKDLATEYQAIVGAIEEIPAQVAEELKQQFSDILDVANKNNKALEDLATVLDELKGAQAQGIEDILDKVEALHNYDATAIKGMIDEVVSGKFDDITGLIEDLEESLSEDGELYKQIIAGIKDVVEELAGANGTNYNDLKAYIEGLNTATNGMVDALAGKVEQAIDGIDSINGILANINQSALTTQDLAKLYEDIIKELDSTEQSVISAINVKIGDLVSEVAAVKTAANNLATVLNSIKTTTNANSTKIEEILSAINNIGAVELGDMQDTLDDIKKVVDNITTRISANGTLVDEIVGRVEDLLEDIAADAAKAAAKAEQAATNAANAVAAAQDAANKANAAKTAAEAAKAAAEQVKVAADAAKAAAEQAKAAIDGLNNNSVDAKEAAEAAKVAAEKAELAAKAAEEAAKAAADKSQAAEVQAQVAIAIEELETWVIKYVENIITVLGKTEGFSAQAMAGDKAVAFVENEASFRTQLAEKVQVAYNERNARLILAYYDQAMAQMSMASTKEEVNYALETFKVNVELVNSLVETQAQDNVAVYQLALIVEILVAVAVVAIILSIVFGVFFFKKNNRKSC